MRLLVVGGRLQGTEAVYLAAKAGFETVLVDRRPEVPAAGLAARTVTADITADESVARALVQACDAVLPACEDEATLAWLAARVPAWGRPLLFDLDAWRVTASKAASRDLFARLGVPAPRPWPECGLPAIVKPDDASGSAGVTLARSEREVAEAVARLAGEGHAAVVEEYVPGPSLSLEVLGWDGRVVTGQVTGLEFDAVYDCKRVVAPVPAAGAAPQGGAPAAGSGRPVGNPPRRGSDWDAGVPAAALASLLDSGRRLAAALRLQGIMDVEVMVSGDRVAVLEIDARLPSQTPTAVYWSSGLNLVAALAAAPADGLPGELDVAPRRACVYEHLWAHDGVLEVSGEHVVAVAGPLTLVPGFFGADEALTDYRPGAARWVATVIATAATVAEARARAHAVAVAAAERESLDLQPEAEPCHLPGRA